MTTYQRGYQKSSALGHLQIFSELVTLSQNYSALAHTHLRVAAFRQGGHPLSLGEAEMEGMWVGWDSSAQLQALG